MGPNGSENVKMLLLLQIDRSQKFSSLSWTFLPKLRWEFFNFEFPIFNDFFFENFKLTIKKLWKKSETSIIWKTSDRRAIRSEIWDSWVVIQHIRDTFGILAFNVILGSFGALVFSCNLGLMIRDGRKPFERPWELNGERKTYNYCIYQ